MSEHIKERERNRAHSEKYSEYVRERDRERHKHMQRENIILATPQGTHLLNGCWRCDSCNKEMRCGSRTQHLKTLGHIKKARMKVLLSKLAGTFIFTECVLLLFLSFFVWFCSHNFVLVAWLFLVGTADKEKTRDRERQRDMLASSFNFDSLLNSCIPQEIQQLQQHSGLQHQYHLM
jgi:hypothetical protein